MLVVRERGAVMGACKDVCMKPGSETSHLYFPTEGIISMLEQRACECYTVVKKEYERLLSNGC
jgi:hypothetical protein